MNIPLTEFPLVLELYIVCLLYILWILAIWRLRHRGVHSQ